MSENNHDDQTRCDCRRSDVDPHARRNIAERERTEEDEHTAARLREEHGRNRRQHVVEREPREPRAEALADLGAVEPFEEIAGRIRHRLHVGREHDETLDAVHSEQAGHHDEAAIGNPAPAGEARRNRGDPDEHAGLERQACEDERDVGSDIDRGTRPRARQMHRDEHQHGHLQKVIDRKRFPDEAEECVEADEDRQREECRCGIGPRLDCQKAEEQRKGGGEERDVECLVRGEVMTI